MTKILATIKKKPGMNATISVSTRAVFGDIHFVGSDPTMLTSYRDGQRVIITIKPFKG